MQLRPKNWDDVFAAPDLSLALLAGQLTVTGIRAVLSIMVGHAVMFFNVGKTMDAGQIALTCDLIADAYPYFKLEDLALCFRKAMMLEYGKLYDRMDGAVIMEWLGRYSAGRDEYASLLSQSRAAEDAAQNGGACYYADYLANLKQRADGGDAAAAEHLEAHLALKSLLKRDEESYRRYVKDREYKRLHGR